MYCTRISHLLQPGKISNEFDENSSRIPELWTACWYWACLETAQQKHLQNILGIHSSPRHYSLENKSFSYHIFSVIFISGKNLLDIVYTSFTHLDSFMSQLKTQLSSIITMSINSHSSPQNIQSSRARFFLLFWTWPRDLSGW